MIVLKAQIVVDSCKLLPNRETWLLMWRDLVEKKVQKIKEFDMVF